VSALRNGSPGSIPGRVANSYTHETIANQARKRGLPFSDKPYSDILRQFAYCITNLWHPPRRSRQVAGIAPRRNPYGRRAMKSALRWSKANRQDAKKPE